MSEINGDLLDDGLQAVMGRERCQNVWTAPEKKERYQNVHEDPQEKSEGTKLRKDEPAEAGWVKLNTVSPLARVKCCAKWALLFGSISGLLFYWQQAGLLDSKAAVPSLIVCALGAGLSIGWHAK